MKLIIEDLNKARLALSFEEIDITCFKGGLEQFHRAEYISFYDERTNKDRYAV